MCVRHALISHFLPPKHLQNRFVIFHQRLQIQNPETLGKLQVEGQDIKPTEGKCFPPGLPTSVQKERKKEIAHCHINLIIMIRMVINML